jgi:hypothetical protein
VGTRTWWAAPNQQFWHNHPGSWSDASPTTPGMRVSTSPLHSPCPNCFVGGAAGGLTGGRALCHLAGTKAQATRQDGGRDCRGEGFKCSKHADVALQTDMTHHAHMAHHGPCTSKCQQLLPAGHGSLGWAATNTQVVRQTSHNGQEEPGFSLRVVPTPMGGAGARPGCFNTRVFSRHPKPLYALAP